MLDMVNPGPSLGGIATSKKLIKEARDRYYSNPKKCMNCSRIIEIREGQRASDVKRKKFCDKSCAAIFHNGLKLDRTKFKKEGLKKCPICDKSILRYRKYCDECYDETRRVETFSSRTKGDIFKKSKNYQTARARIGSHARKIFFMSEKPRECFVCGYTLHVDIAHIKDVKDFEEHVTIKEINDINNLVALCKNHHWEFDNDILDIKCKI